MNTHWKRLSEGGGVSNGYPQHTVFNLITTHTYKCTVKQLRSLQITASVSFVYFFIKTYVVGTRLNCINSSMRFKWVSTIYVSIKKIRKQEENILSFADLLYLKCTLSTGRYIFHLKFPEYFLKKKKLSLLCRNKVEYGMF